MRRGASLQSRSGTSCLRVRTASPITKRQNLTNEDNIQGANLFAHSKKALILERERREVGAFVVEVFVLGTLQEIDHPIGHGRHHHFH